ncbi:hypothetical protein KY285_008060 [Solanum tuberosum]|nr:hypothetical protein KY285_008060 [Solanum tuberosum]
MLIDEREYPVASIFNSIAKRFGELFRERHAYIFKSMGNQMVPAAEKLVVTPRAYTPDVAGT